MINRRIIPHTVTRFDANTTQPGPKVIQFKAANKYYRLYPDGYLVIYNLSKTRIGDVVAHLGDYRPRSLRVVGTGYQI